MPDYKKFMQMKQSLASLSEMMADYEKDFGEASGEGDGYGDKDANDGGQESLSDMNPLDTAPPAGDKKKSRNMDLIAGMTAEVYKKKKGKSGY